MLGIIAYGSLINRQEAKNVGSPPIAAIPVKLRNFKRSFNQRPAWRKETSENTAVLNVQKSQTHWINGICYCFENFDFALLDEREKGYTRTLLKPEGISSYTSLEAPLPENIYIYLGKAEYLNESLLPHQDYLNICLRGAQNWGDNFAADFSDTTYIRNGILLQDLAKTITK